MVSLLKLGRSVVKAVRTSSVRRSSVKTERNFDLTFRDEFMVLADYCFVKCGSRSWSSWPPLVYFMLSCVGKGLCDEQSLAQRNPTTNIIRLEYPHNTTGE
jgi:hypothetical protein